jgi:Zn-dependent protease
VYDVVEAFVALMDRMTLGDALVLMVAGTIVAPLVVLIHEAGHAIAALALRRRVDELTVGDDDPFLTMRAGRFRLHLGAITGRGDVAGFVRYDGLGADVRSTFVIALAGPLASLAGAGLTAALAARAWPHVGLSLFLALATVGGLICCVGNLRVSGHDPVSWSDGVWVRAAWRVMRTPTPPSAA